MPLEITFDFGFNLKSSFNQVFKQIIGKTHSDYRKNLSNANDLDDKNLAE